jgi:hypothetical protein
VASPLQPSKHWSMVVQSWLLSQALERARQAPESAQLVQSWQVSVWGHALPPELEPELDVDVELPPVPEVDVDVDEEQPQIIVRRMGMSQRMRRA